jgi:hypothetical protein
METAMFDPAFTISTQIRNNDLLTQAVASLRQIRFLEFGIRSHHQLVVYANAYRAGERDWLNRDRLDVSLRELELRTNSCLENERGPDQCVLIPSHRYRAGDLRFASGSAGETKIWNLISGLVFNLVSIDARVTTEGRAEHLHAMPMFLLESSLKHGLLDSDGFYLAYFAPEANGASDAGPGVEVSLKKFAEKVLSRFALRSETLALTETNGLIRFFPS